MAETQLAVMDTGFDPATAEGVPWITRIESHSAWSIVSRLPMMLAVGIPLDRFTVRNLLTLAPGQTLTSAWAQTGDIPIAIGQVRFAWSEFEVSGQRIAVRLTQLL